MSIDHDTARGLMAGLGSEDIAVRYGHPPERVRAIIRNLRARKLLRGFMCRSWRGTAAKLLRHDIAQVALTSEETSR